MKKASGYIVILFQQDDLGDNMQILTQLKNFLLNTDEIYNLEIASVTFFSSRGSNPLDSQCMYVKLKKNRYKSLARIKRSIESYGKIILDTVSKECKGSALETPTLLSFTRRKLRIVLEKIFRA